MGPSYYVTPAPERNAPSRKMMLIGGGIVAALILGIILMFSSNGNSIGSQLTRLSLRLGNLQAILGKTEITRKIKNEDLSRVVTDFSLNLNSDVNDLTPLMVAAGLPENPDASVATSEADTSTVPKLDDAGLKNHLDSAYAEVLVIKIDSLRALIAEIYSQTNNTKLKSSLANTDKHLFDMKKRIVTIQNKL